MTAAVSPNPTASRNDTSGARVVTLEPQRIGVRQRILPRPTPKRPLARDEVELIRTDERPELRASRSDCGSRRPARRRRRGGVLASVVAPPSPVLGATRLRSVGPPQGAGTTSFLWWALSLLSVTMSFCWVPARARGARFFLAGAARLRGRTGKSAALRVSSVASPIGFRELRAGRRESSPSSGASLRPGRASGLRHPRTLCATPRRVCQQS